MREDLERLESFENFPCQILLVSRAKKCSLSNYALSSIIPIKKYLTKIDIYLHLRLEMI